MNTFFSFFKFFVGSHVHISLQPSVIFAGFSEADIARSLLFTVSNDIGQIASLYAMLHGLKKVRSNTKIFLNCIFRNGLKCSLVQETDII